MAAEGKGSLIGRQLGTYELLRLLGVGGMAEVYLAHDLELDRRVAVKVLLRELTREAKFERRFRSEAKRVANLHHPHIVHIHAAGVTDDGLLYMVMPLVPRSLRQRLVQGPPLSIEESVRLAQEVAAALAAAHQVGLIHRDVKPENILLDEQNQALLTDFGIARSLDASLDALDLDHPPMVPTLSASGLPVGTPEYMSAEQLCGVPLDQRADIYSLGAVLYEMLSGHLPHTGATPYLVATHSLTEPVVPPSRYNPRVWPELEAVVLCAMAVNREQRYPSAPAFSSALAEAMRRRDTHAQPSFVPSATAPDTPATVMTDSSSEALIDLPTAMADAAEVAVNAIVPRPSIEWEVKTAPKWVRAGISVHRWVPWVHLGWNAGWGWALTTALLLLTVGVASVVGLTHPGAGGTSSGTTTIAGLAAQTPRPGATHTANTISATASAGATTTAQSTAQGTPQPTTSPSATATPGALLTLSPNPLGLTATNGTPCTGTLTITNSANSGAPLGWQWTSMSSPPSGWVFSFKVASASGSTTYQYPTLPQDGSGIAPGGHDALTVTATNATATPSASTSHAGSLADAASLSVLPVGPCALGGQVDVAMTDANQASYQFAMTGSGGVSSQ